MDRTAFLVARLQKLAAKDTIPTPDQVRAVGKPAAEVPTLSEAVLSPTQYEQAQGNKRVAQAKMPVLGVKDIPPATKPVGKVEQARMSTLTDAQLRDAYAKTSEYLGNVDKRELNFEEDKPVQGAPVDKSEKSVDSAAMPKEKNASLVAPDDKSVTKPADECADAQQSDVIHPTVVRALSQQVGNEFYAAYTYYGAAGWFKLQGLDGFAKMAEEQATGEIGHARKVFDHLITAGCPAVLPALEGGVLDQYTSVLQVCESILKHEKSVTKSWRLICSAAMQTGDGATTGLAQWFLAEQLEEENLAATLRDRVKMAGGDGAGILTIDASLM
jgi:ferritin